MTVSEVRKRYLDFFAKRGHVVIPSAPIVPGNDPTTLFTSSGMQPLLPYFLGKDHPEGKRVVNSQMSFRAGDIEEVGDNRHTTFFEMLGNWSFGDYFKKEQLPWLYEFLTSELGIPKERLAVTCFEGDATLNLPKDEESARIWKELGISEDRIHFYGAKKNWWSRSGTPDLMPSGEPGGPDSEVFYEFDIPHDPAFGATCHPNCDCGRFMEIGNSVFMEYLKNADGSFGKLPKQNVDFGGGLERLTAATHNNPDVFLIDVFHAPRKVLEGRSGKIYGSSTAVTRSFRIIMDHMRAASFMLAEEIQPSNTEAGYVLRRLIRRSILEVDRLGIQDSILSQVSASFADSYKDQYPHIGAARDIIFSELLKEEEKFRKTLSQGLKEFNKLPQGTTISGDQAHILATTYGFPIELTVELAHERGDAVDVEGYETEKKKHQDLSRSGAAQKFAGGLADHSEQTVRYHTTHHILLKALQMVLGPEVKQRGSNITAERLRIDFASAGKMTDEQKAAVEKIVNDTIYQDLPVTRTVMPREEAEKLGAQMEFGVKYPDMVSVYSVGPKDATETNPKIPEAFSLEFCGGPHVGNTSEIHEGGKKFKIQKEEAVAAGIRRIKAILV